MTGVLVVEDESIIALLIEDLLGELHYEVATFARSVDEGVAAARGGTFDFAILDLNLRGELSLPIARALAERKIPFFFATGYGEQNLGEEFANVPIVAKPFARDRFVDAIRKIISEPAHARAPHA